MTDTVANQPVFGIQRAYLKGQSLEMPQGAKIFLNNAQVALNLNLQVSSSQLDDGIYEVTLRGTLTAELDSKVHYLVECEFAGIFELRHVDDTVKADLLDISAPAILAPYLRAQLADTLTRATLPVFYMPEVNWPAVAQERRAQEAAQAAQAPTISVIKAAND